jgi:cell division ATPase FtsA
MAGFREIALVEEPVASLIGLRNNKSRSSARGLHLVVDFGAGTCDVALMEKSEGNHHFVIDSDSDNNLGGRKIDEELLKWVISRSPYELDDERPIILGEGVKPDTRIYYHALWQVEKWKISQNEYFKGRIAKPERLNLSLAGLQKLSKNITSISREDFEQIVESHIADRLNSLFVHVLNNQKERLQNVKSIVLTGGSSRLIGFRSLVTEFVAEISGLDMDSVEDLIVEAQDPRWTVVRGTAIVDYGLTVGNRIVTSPLPHNIELEVKNGETNEELKLLQGTLRIRGRSASVDRRLPFQKCFRMRVIEDAHCVCINIYLDTRSEDSLVDRLTMTPIHGHKIIPKGTLIEVHYRITEGGTFHVERFLVGSKIESRIKHDVFHHTDEDGKPSCEVIESRRKFSLVPEMEKIPQNKEEVKSFFESLPFYTQDFLESINWKKRLRDFAWGFVLVFLFFGNVFVALGFGLIISATMPEHIDLVEIVLERLKEILGRLQ